MESLAGRRSALAREEADSSVQQTEPIALRVTLFLPHAISTAGDDALYPAREAMSVFAEGDNYRIVLRNGIAIRTRIASSRSRHRCGSGSCRASSGRIGAPPRSGRARARLRPDRSSRHRGTEDPSRDRKHSVALRENARPNRRGRGLADASVAARAPRVRARRHDGCSLQLRAGCRDRARSTSPDALRAGRIEGGARTVFCRSRRCAMVRAAARVAKWHTQRI